MKLAQKITFLSVTLLVLYVTVMAGTKTAQAATVGHGARIISYGDEGQARFHMGAVVGGEEMLMAEPVEEETLTNVQFTTSDSSVCSIRMTGDICTVQRKKEGIAVITMTCKADGEDVERSLLMSNLTPLFTEPEEEPDDEEDSEEDYWEEEDDSTQTGQIEIVPYYPQGIVRAGTKVYYGCSDLEGITSKSTEIKTTLTSQIRTYVKYQCNDFYRIELFDEEDSFGESGECWGYVKKSQVSIPVSKVTAKQSISCFAGETVSMDAVVEPSFADNRALKYHSSNEQVATVDGHGSIKTYRKGRVTITATSVENEKYQAKCEVDVQSFVPVSGIELTPKDMKIEDGTTGYFDVHVLPEDATRQEYRIMSTDDSVLMVYEDGYYRAKKPGTTTVMAISEEGSFRAESKVEVTAVPARGVTLQKAMSIDVGETRLPLWSMVPKNATNKDVTWKSSNPQIAEVDKQGYVTGLQVGQAVITLSSREGSYEASCVVTVETYVDDLRLNHHLLDMSLGETKTLKVKILPEKVTKKKIIWNSKATDVVTVNQTGKLTAKGTGRAEITVYDRYTGVYDTCVVSVNADLGKPTLKGKLTKKGIKLTWNKIPRATNYVIYRYSKKKKEYVKLATKSSTKRSLIVKKAKKGTKFRVKSYYKKSDEYSKFSNTYKVKKNVERKK